jgi:hypothetical protein
MLRITVRLPFGYVAWAREKGHGNVSEGLRLLLEQLDEAWAELENRKVPTEPDPLPF